MGPVGGRGFGGSVKFADGKTSSANVPHLNAWGFDISAAEFSQPKKTRVFGVKRPLLWSLTNKTCCHNMSVMFYGTMVITASFSWISQFLIIMGNEYRGDCSIFRWQGLEHGPRTACRPPTDPPNYNCFQFHISFAFLWPQEFIFSY